MNGNARTFSVRRVKGVLGVREQTKPGRKELGPMKAALILPFVLIAIAPLVGKWRANVWLKKNVKARVIRNTGASLVETT